MTDTPEINDDLQELVDLIITRCQRESASGGRDAEFWRAHLAGDCGSQIMARHHYTDEAAREDREARRTGAVGMWERVEDDGASLPPLKHILLALDRVLDGDEELCASDICDELRPVRARLCEFMDLIDPIATDEAA